MSPLRRDPLQDFKDFLKILNTRKVKFVIVGAHAMTHWGYTRATGDLDILILPSEKNSQRLLQTLSEFGAPTADLSVEDFSRPGQVLQLGVPPLRIDILTSLSGVDGDVAFRSSKKAVLLGVSARFLSLDHLITNKLTVGRPKDKIDVAELRKLKGGGN